MRPFGYLVVAHQLVGYGWSEKFGGRNHFDARSDLDRRYKEYMSDPILVAQSEGSRFISCQRWRTGTV